MSKLLVIMALVSVSLMAQSGEAQIIRRIIRGVPMNCENGLCTPTAQAFAPQVQQYYPAPQTVQYFAAPITYSQPVQVRSAAPQMYHQRPARAPRLWRR